jgi:uncharacterized repeat protein (TIGR03803 family)
MRTSVRMLAMPHRVPGIVRGTPHSEDTMNSGRRRLLGFVMVLLALTIAPAGAGTYEVMHPFNGGIDDGLAPQDATLVLGPDGWLYGTTSSGGHACGSGCGFGAIYKIRTDKTGFTLIHRFAGSDGALPDAALLLVGNTLYGTTYWWGTFNAGTLFKVGTDGLGFEVLHQFGDRTSDGANPVGPLTMGDDGYLYGTTYVGGTSNVGTVFRMKPDKTGYQVLHNFTGVGVNGGANPWTGLVRQGTSLYGTTNAGGEHDLGTIFTLTTSGTGHAVLHAFDGSDGEYPVGGLVADASSFLYGTTSSGGSGRGGTIFKISTSGAGFDVLHEFGLNPNDGSAPRGTLALYGPQTLFGTTMFGGLSGRGTVFTLHTDGTGFGYAWQFGAVADGVHPRASVIADAAGTLYGTTQNGGSVEDGGVIFKLSGIVLDTTPPSVTCTAPSTTGWRATNVNVACSAGDTGSGLAGPGAFTLSTNVSPNTESTNAFTDAATVCDFALNCVEVGPYGPYMIDQLAPSITISAPSRGAVFAPGQVVLANYGCDDGAGSGVASCSGTVANGSPIDTATVGPKTFAVNASDRVNNTSPPVTVSYTVVAGPTTSAIVLTSALNPSLVGQQVTITAAVSGAAPTGLVTFFVDGAPLGSSVPINTSGVATKFFIGNASGSYALTAHFSSADQNNTDADTVSTLWQLVRADRSSGTATKAMVSKGVDDLDGGFAQRAESDAGTVGPISHGSAGIPVIPGPSVGAYAGVPVAGGSGARAIAFGTYVNTDQSTSSFHLNAQLKGQFLGSGRVIASVHVVDPVLFLKTIENSGQTLPQFLVGTDLLVDYANASPSALSIARLFPSSAWRATDSEVVSPATFLPVDLQTSPAISVAPGQSVIFVFDLIVTATSGINNFAETLEPAAVFLTDPAGNPVSLTPLGPWTPTPPAAAGLTLAPPTATSPLTSAVSVAATATTATGGPVEGALVFFDVVSGPNTQALGPRMTDASGQARFSYSGGTAVGTDQIRARLGTLQSNVAEVTWTPGPLDHITISPASATIAAGGSQAYTTHALDVFDNGISTVTEATMLTISPDGSCAAASCTASAPGPHTVTATYNGKTATAALQVTAVTSAFTFDGFFDPIEMSTPEGDVWNTVKAGQTVPVKWRLTRGGAPVSDPASFDGVTTYPVACPGAGSIEDAIEQTANGNSGLQYIGSGYWQFNWGTSKAWRSSCGTLVVRFSDGTTSPAALFKFK